MTWIVGLAPTTGGVFVGKYMLEEPGNHRDIIEVIFVIWANMMFSYVFIYVLLYHCVIIAVI